MPGLDLLTGQIGQISFVVPDLDEAVASYARLFPARSWVGFTLASEQHASVEYRGRPAEFVARLAVDDGSPVTTELIEPVSGESAQRDWLERRGVGLHHVGYAVPSVRDAVDRMASAGFEVVMAGYGFGVDGDGAYAFFDTEAELGYLVEAYERPRTLGPPEIMIAR